MATSNKGGSFYSENPHANLKGGGTLSGHYDCRENLVANCGSTYASFAFLVIVAGVVIFGVYVTKQRRRSAAPLEETEEKVTVDDEGWEKRAEDE